MPLMRVSHSRITHLSVVYTLS